MFVARKGTLLVRFDYSAHEVRVWSYVGKDKVLADVFRIGQQLRQKFIQDPSDENRKMVKEKGDLHILNVKRFFNKQIDKDHPLRDAVKAVIFGAIYSKGAETLGEDTKSGDRQALMKRIGAKDATPKEVAKAEAELKALMAEDRTPYAQDILDKLFNEFKRAAAWTEKMKKLATEKYYVYSPTGRLRRLYAAMTGDRTIVNQQARRGSNAPVQGFASEIGIKAGRLIIETYYDELPNLCELLDIEYDEWELRVPYNRVVHDANYFSVIYPMVIPFIHILQYSSTYGVTQTFLKEFGVEFGIEPEIEVEVGARDDATHKWDWSIPALVKALISSIDDAEAGGLLEGTRDEVIDQVFAPWRSKKTRAYLQEKWPLLGVSDLDNQISAAMKELKTLRIKKEKE